MNKPLLSFLVFIALTFVPARDRGRERTNVVTGDGQLEVTVMDFSAPFSLDPLPAGWYHRTFWTRGPMQTAFAVKNGVPPTLRISSIPPTPPPPPPPIFPFYTATCTNC